MIRDFFRTYLYFWLPVVIFVVLANAIRGGEPLPGDTPVLLWLYSFSSPLLDTVFQVITFIGGAAFIIPAVLVAAAVLYSKKRRGDALFALFAVGGAAVINATFKLLFARERPQLWEHIVVEHGYSFPSGHAMMSSAAAFTVVALLWHTAYRLPAILAGLTYFILVGLSRLYLGVHYPSDVLAGWCISLVWVLVLYKVFSRFRRRFRKITGSSFES